MTSRISTGTRRDPSPIAKITRPVLGATFARRRLFRILDRSRKQPMVWVSGPPGCGKTAMVSSYVTARGSPCLWYRVDESDQDIASFFHYLALAARRAVPGVRRPLPLLAPEYLSGLSSFARKYFEDLFGRLDPGSVVVFDDYQKVPADCPLHDTIREGLSRVPEGVTGIVISRSGPPPSFARDRVHKRMELIGWKDLRLTPEETQGILRQRGGRKRSAEEIRILQSRSDGWAAGLVLLVEQSAEGGGEPRRLSGRTPGEVFEYFGGEIFAGLEEDAKTFLLKSAFLPKMTARMAHRITAHRGAGTILAGLHRNNYFTELHRDAEPVYAYHPLFRDFLLSRAEEAFSARSLKRLRAAAGAVLEESGRDEDAVEVYRELGDREGVARIALRQASRLVAQGRGGTLAEWIASLPENACREHPRLLYFRAVCRLPSRPAESLRDFEEAFRRFREAADREGTLLSWAGAVDAILVGPGSLTSLDSWLATLAEILESPEGFPSPEVESQVTCTVVKALALRRPSFLDTEEWARRAVELAGSTRDAALKFSLLLNVSYCRFHGGDFPAVGLLLESLRELARKPEISPLPRLSLYWLEAALANMSGLHDRCMTVVNEGLAYAEATGIRIMDFLLMGHGALCSLHWGDLPAAMGFLKKMAASLPAARPWEASFYHHLACWEALSRGDRAGAVYQSDLGLALCRRVGNPWSEALAILQRAFLSDRRGESDEASRQVERARRIGEERRMRFVRFACLLAAAYFSIRRGEKAAGLASLRDGLRIGREHGYVDTYLWCPGLLETIVAAALEHGIEPEYARELVRGNALVPDGPLRDLETWPWPLKVYTLGRFALLADEKPLTPSRKVQRKPLLMLKALIALGGRDVAEENVSDILWPEAEGDLAHQSFAMTLSRLRRLVGDERALVLREGRLTLDARYCWVDSFAFESLLAQVDAAARGEWRASDEPRATRLAAQAISLFKGPFLPGEVSEPWILGPRERLRSKFLRAVEWMGRRLEREGRLAEAVDCYRRGLEVDDLAEGFYQRLMVCHRRLGQTAEALRVYERCRKALDAVLGIPPSPETQTIAQSLS